MSVTAVLVLLALLGSAVLELTVAVFTTSLAHLSGQRLRCRRAVEPAVNVPMFTDGIGWKLENG